MRKFNNKRLFHNRNKVEQVSHENIKMTSLITFHKSLWRQNGLSAASIRDIRISRWYKNDFGDIALDELMTNNLKNARARGLKNLLGDKII